MTKKERMPLHKERMKERRARQLARTPSMDGRITFFSKNSDPEYRKN